MIRYMSLDKTLSFKLVQFLQKNNSYAQLAAWLTSARFVVELAAALAPARAGCAFCTAFSSRPDSSRALPYKPLAVFLASTATNRPNREL